MGIIWPTEHRSIGAVNVSQPTYPLDHDATLTATMFRLAQWHIGMSSALESNGPSSNLDTN